MAKANPYSFFVVLSDGIMEIPQSSNLSWLTLFYALPKELVENALIIWNFHEISISSCNRRNIKSSSNPMHFLNWFGTATHGQHGSIFQYRARMAHTGTFPVTGRTTPVTFHSGDCPMRFRSISATSLKRKWNGVSKSYS